MIRTSFFYLAALVVWCVVYWADLPLLLNEWNQDDYSHCWLVLPIVGYIVWGERQRVRQFLGKGCGVGLLLLVVSILFFFVGRLGSLKFFVFLSMWGSLCGVAMLWAGSRSFKVLWFPFVVGLFLIPLPPFISRLTSLKLRLISSVLAEKFLQVFQIPVYREGNIIDLGVIQLQVVDACSGLRYLWPSLLMALLIGWMYLHTSWKRWVLVAIAIPVTVLSNAFRIAITGVLTKFIDPALAEGFFHDFSGWLVYVFSLGLLGYCAWLMRTRHTLPAAERQDDASFRVVQTPWWYGGIALVCLSCMWGGEHYYHTNRTFPHREAFATFPSQVGVWSASPERLSSPVLKSLGLDDYYNATFYNTETGDVAYVLVSWYDHQTTSHAAHAPTSCLVGSGWSILTKHPLPPSQQQGRGFPITQMVLQRNTQQIISNFWFVQRGRVVVNEWLNKWYLLQDALLQQRTDGALVRVEMIVRPGVNLASAQSELDRFAGQLRTALSPHLPQSYSVEE